MTQQRAAVVFTDPPCNVPTEGHASGLGEKQHRDFATACGEMSRTEFTDFFGHGLQATGQRQPRRRDSLSVHRLAPRRRTPGGG